MKLSRRALLLGALGVGVAGAVPVSGTYRFEVSRHARALPGLRAPLRVALLSDLHYGPFIRAGSVRAWFDAAMRARPDLVLVTGDFVDSDLGDDVAPLLAEVRRVAAPLGVWGVWGNHDYGSFGSYAHRFGRGARFDWEARRDAFALDLSKAGLTVLRNAGRQIRDDLHLAGVDDLWWGEPDLKRALAGERRGATLLMSHNPDLLPDVPRDVALTVSGHTHGGQVRLPLIGPVVTGSRFGTRFAEGFVEGPAPGFVSRGLGVSGLPARLDCPPEVVLFDFTPA